VTLNTAEREAQDEGPIMPRELLWLYPIAPLGGAALLVQDLFDRSVWEGLRNVSAVYVPFVVFSVIFHVIYDRWVPRWFFRVRSSRARWATHVLLGAVVPLLLSPIVAPLHDRLCLHHVPMVTFMATSVVFSWLFVLPSAMVQQLRNQAAQQERQAAAARQAALGAQLSALQARTNPHFFFNSINTVASLIPEDPERAERTLERLADLLRYSLDAAKTPTVSLLREVEIIRDYVEIQRARFGDRLQVSIEIDPEAEGLQVPALLLQPLVENAILHGMAQRKGGRIGVLIRRSGAGVTAQISDDGPGPGASPHRGSQTSMIDLRERLRILYGDAGTLLIEGGPEGGCVATVTLPAGGAS